MTDHESALRAEREFLYPNYRQPDFVLVRGQGARVWDETGKEYLDLTAGIAVNCLGHAHPTWVKAVAEQAGKLAHVSNYFYNEPNLRLARALCHAAGMARALFCNSGTEAIEGCLKLARRYHYDRGQIDRHRVIAFENAFHGRTLGALAATGQPSYRDGFGPLSIVTHVAYNDLDAVKAAMGDDVAAILVEPVQGEGGVRPASAAFLRGLRELTDKTGALLIADEIQTGVGRSGRFLAMEHAEVRPDVVALAKGLGGGFPIGAVLSSTKYEEALPPGSHGSTFGGNPLASAAALAVLQALQEEDLIAAASRKGALLQELLQALARKHPKKVAEARGLGLLRALELKAPYDVRQVLGTLRDAGVLLTAAGGSALRFTPPLTIGEGELQKAVEIVDSVLEGLK